MKTIVAVARFTLLAAVAVCGIGLFLAPARAADRYWNPTSSDRVTGGGASWNGSTGTVWRTAATGGSQVVIGTNNQAIFQATAGTLTLTGDIAAGVLTGNSGAANAGAINFNVGGYTIDG